MALQRRLLGFPSSGGIKRRKTINNVEKTFSQSGKRKDASRMREGVGRLEFEERKQRRDAEKVTER